VNLFTLKFLFILISCILSAQCQAEESPNIQLATVYKPDDKKPINIDEYFISEKLDGIRGFWNGKKLFTRRGNIIYAPAWFIKNWPNTHIDGELWSNRGEFEKISSCARKHKPLQQENISCWRKLHFMIFDLPKNLSAFNQRIQKMTNLVKITDSAYFLAVKQEKVNSIALLNQKLSTVVNLGGEGLMLHHKDAYYKAGRSNKLLKLKRYDDAEAIVIAHIKGKGKYKNKLGSLKVELLSGLTFKIGTGFTDKQRKNPPAIGSTVTFKYIGKTARGVPKFASFLRVRKPPSTQ
jgi:DNA ligase-1